MFTSCALINTALLRHPGKAQAFGREHVVTLESHTHAQTPHFPLGQSLGCTSGSKGLTPELKASS